MQLGFALQSFLLENYHTLKSKLNDFMFKGLVSRGKSWIQLDIYPKGFGVKTGLVVVRNNAMR